MSRVLTLLLALTLLGGCEGLIADGPTGPRGQTRTPPGPTLCDTLTVAPSGMSRLTRVEYDYAIEDLFGDTSAPARTFSPDDVTTGFEVGGPVAPLLAEQYLDTANAVASRATADVATLTGCGIGAACARTFATRLGRRAYRRALETAELDALVALYERGVELADHQTGIQLVIEALLTSPAFLYHLETLTPEAAAGVTLPLSGYERAARLSFFLWRSIPDDALLDDAESGMLDTNEGMEDVARRMLADGRASRSISDFHRQWLELDRLGSIERSAAVYPEWNRDLGRAMRTSLDSYLAEVMATGTVQDLFLGDFAYVNAPLADVYGIPGVTGDEMQRLSVDMSQRSGILTHPGLMALLGKANQSDPIHRGVFVRQRLLCQQLPAPPDDVDLTPPEPEPGLTTRDRFSAHREEVRCAGCHTLIDPIGFGFEHYDGVGRYRATEEGHDIDASGEVIAGGDASGTFDGVLELSAQLAESDTVRGCVARQWMRYATGRIETAEDRCTVETLQERFAASGYDMRELLVAVVSADSFTHRRIPADPASTAP